MKQVYKQLLTALLSIFIFSSANAAILYVKPATGSTAWQDKTTVYSDLQTALADAISGDQLWVAAGTYKPTTGTDRTISFQLKDGVELYGGFAGEETELGQRNWQKNPTILSGDIGVAEDNTDNSCHVLTAIATEPAPISNSAIIDGFIIEDGYASFSSNINNSGGGLYLSYASPLIRNTWFRNNYAYYNGGAVYASSSSALFANVLFTNNRSDYDGGAVNAYKSAMTFHSCLFYENYSINPGGAISSYPGEPEVNNSIFWNNESNANNPNIRNVSVTYSLVQGESSGNGNIDANPLLIDPENGDFRLSMNSPAFQAGNSELVPDWLTIDFAGNSRITNGKINMGVLEGKASTPILTLPEDKTFFDNDITEASLSWQLPEEMTENFSSFTLEY
ncbi:MAG: hypothetical protein GXY94_04685, partial [Bacteroidales bacterium]|nr:hypothetical protein [Bacteroidales bacterium]